MGRNQALPAAPGLVAEIRAALLERQGLLTGPDPSTARDRMDTLDTRLKGLMDQLTAMLPPAAALEDEAAVPGEFDRFLDRGDAQHRTG